MELKEAMDVLELKDLREVTEEQLKINYRRLARKHHPDVGGEHIMAVKINNANEIIRHLLDEIELMNKLHKLLNKETIFGIIPFDKFISLYTGESIELKNNDGIYKLTRRNVKANDIVLEITCKLNIDGIEQSFRTLSKVNNTDEYYIVCRITDKNIESDRVLTLIAYNKKIDITLKGMSTSILLNYGNIAKLKVTIERRIASDG